MARQTITISKAGSDWANVTAANLAIESTFGSETKVWWDTTAKTSNGLTSFADALEDANTIVYTRTWSADGWTAVSEKNRSGKLRAINRLKEELESDGYTVTVVQPSYV